MSKISSLTSWKKRVFFSGTVTPLPIVVSTRASVSTTPVSSSIVVSSQPGILLPAVQATESTDISHSHGSSGFKVTKMITIWISMSALLAIIVSKNCHSLIYSTWTWGQNQNMYIYVYRVYNWSKLNLRIRNVKSPVLPCTVDFQAFNLPKGNKDRPNLNQSTPNHQYLHRHTDQYLSLHLVPVSVTILLTSKSTPLKELMRILNLRLLRITLKNLLLSQFTWLLSTHS